MNLAPHAKTICRHLLGEPNRDHSTKEQWRYGNKGALAVEVAGDKAGTYYDFEHEQGGSLLELISREKGFSNGEAFAWLRSELGIGDEPQPGGKYKVAGTWVYRGRDGTPLYRAVRRDCPGKQKKFHQERYDAATDRFVGEKGCMNGVRLVPYRLPDWIDGDGPILIPEGERKADALVKLGWEATCNAGGAGKFSKGFAVHFQDRHVVLLPDNDEAGRRHVREVAEILKPVASSIRLLELPGLHPKGDVIDWLEAGGTAEELRVLVNGAPAADEVIAGWAPTTATQDDEEDDDTKVKQSIATQLVQIALAGADLFTTPGDQVAYAAFEVGGHREVYPLRSRGFKTWLGRRLHEETKGKKTAGAQAIADALITIEGAALFDGGKHEVYLRTAEHQGRYYLDLADAQWRAVEIGPGGWRVVDRPPVYFRRTRGTLPLPEPVHDGSLEDLREFLNVGDEAAFRMLIAWELAAARPGGPYPVLDLSGEQGAAKTTVARVLRALIDPGDPMVRAAPKEERDLAIAVRNSHVLPLDNMSGVQPWLSDALCRFATGGGWACRQLYTDDEELLIDAQRPIILTGIEELAQRPDLKDRTVGVQLPVIEDHQRVEEDEFWRRFEAARPALLGELLTVMAAGLKRMPGLKLDRMPRMADFAKWITACEPALGWPDGTFMQLYADNRAQLTETVLENNETIRLIRHAAICHGEHESVGSLLDKLRTLCGEDREKLKQLPKTPKALGGLLRRYAPELRAVGIDVVFGKHTKRGWPVTIKERVPAQPSPSSHRHQTARNPQKSANGAGDGMGDRSGDGSESAAQPSPPPSPLKSPDSLGCDGGDGSDGSAGTQSPGEGEGELEEEFII